MNEAHMTITGNVATPIEYRTSAAGVPVTRFRIASTVRRFDQQRGCWADAYTNFCTVWAWRTLAANVASSVSRGEPLIVTGHLRVRETVKDGNHFVSADLTATSIGHDLTRGTSAFVKVSHAKPELVPGSGSAPSPFTEGPAPAVEPAAGPMTGSPAGPAAGPVMEALPGTGAGTAAWTGWPDASAQVSAP